MEYYRDFPDADEVAVSMANEEAYESDDYDVRKFDGQSDQLGYDDLPDDDGEYRRSEDSVKNILARDIHILVNNEAVTLHGKSEYVFVDIFDSIDFDLTRPNGRAIVTTLNGKTPDYLQSIHEGDKIEVYWK